MSIHNPFVGVLLGSTAIVLSNDAPSTVKVAAKVAKRFFGDRIQICDGVEDREEFMAAIDSLPAGGGEVLATSGDYTFDTDTTVHVRVERDDVHIRVLPGATIYVTNTIPAPADGDIYTFKFIGVNRCSLDCRGRIIVNRANHHLVAFDDGCDDCDLFDIRGGGASSTEYGEEGICLYWSSHIRVHHYDVWNLGAGALDIVGLKDSWIGWGRWKDVGLAEKSCAICLWHDPSKPLSTINDNIVIEGFTGINTVLTGGAGDYYSWAAVAWLQGTNININGGQTHGVPRTLRVGTPAGVNITRAISGRVANIQAYNNPGALADFQLLEPAVVYENLTSLDTDGWGFTVASGVHFKGLKAINTDYGLFVGAPGVENISGDITGIRCKHCAVYGNISYSKLDITAIDCYQGSPDVSGSTGIRLTSGSEYNRITGRSTLLERYINEALVAQANAGDTRVQITQDNTHVFYVGQHVTVEDDTPQSENVDVADIDRDYVYFTTPLTNTYTLAQNARIVGRITHRHPVKLDAGADNNWFENMVWYGHRYGPQDLGNGNKFLGCTGPTTGEVLSPGETRTYEKEVNYDDPSPLALCSVERGYVVTDVWVKVLTTWDGVGATLDIGDGPDPDGFLPAASINLGIATFYGQEADERGAYLWDAANSHVRQRVYTSSDTVDATIAPGGGATQGKALVAVKVTKVGW